MESFALCVKIEIDGVLNKVGTISGSDSQNASFSYDKAYLERPCSHPISISLPLTEKRFSAENTRTFFEGLLPSGFSRKHIINALHIDESDYIAVLKILGKDYLGALNISDDSAETNECGYKLIDIGTLDFPDKDKPNTAGHKKTHLSVNGACRKIGLYYDSKNNTWYQPLGLAPSNYIIKWSNDFYENLAVNEQLCLLTAQKLGITIPDSFILPVENKKRLQVPVLFATKRYDRIIDAQSNSFCGLPVPYRLHQEDFSQALGIKLLEKYEPEGKQYLKSMFDILRLHSSNALEDMTQLWKRCVFSYFIGNTDNHIKNFSLVYSKDLGSVKLAPCYDVMSTLIYENISKKMAFSINHKIRIDKITRDDFKNESRLVGYDEELALHAFDEIRDNLDNALYESAKKLDSLGFIEARAIADKILKLGYGK